MLSAWLDHSLLTLVPDLKAQLPDLRGRLLANQPLAELTWFRVGGPAQALFMPEDERRSRAISSRTCRAEIPVTVIGLGSNLIVRDGGVPGVVVRLGRGFSEIKVEGNRVRAGAAVPDVQASRARRRRPASPGLSFLRGIPGAIGGALRMNGGAYGRETKDVLVEARGVDRAGSVRMLRATPTCDFTYRHCGVARRCHLHAGAVSRARPAIRRRSRPRWTRSPKSREATQPIKSRTGGSTFKNPPGAQGLAADRRRRLPRAASSAMRRCRRCTAIS